MKLADLDAKFIRWDQEERDITLVNDPALGIAGGTHVERQMRSFFNDVETLADADGIMFLCPKSFAENKGPVGTHSVLVFFEGSRVPLDCKDLGRDSHGNPARWKASGTGLHDLTLTPSILEGGSDCWHGFVTNGEAG